MIATLAWMMSALLIAALPVEVTTNAGDSVAGELISIDDAAVTLNVGGASQTIAVEDVQVIQPSGVASQTGPTYRVTLVDGSRIAAEEVSLDDGKLTIQLRDQPAITVDVRSVRAIRFRAAAQTTDADWLGLVNRESRGDVMVIRRGTDTLDPIAGVINGIADAKVNFDLDGDAVNAPIAKLEGVLFGGTAAVADNANIRVNDVFGSSWSIDSLAYESSSDNVTMKLSSDLTHSMPIGQVRAIQFAGGMTLVASQSPAEQSSSTFVAIDGVDELASAFFGPKSVGDGDLTMNGSSSVSYRVDEGFKMLAGTVRRSADVKQAGNLTAKILVDGKVVWDQSLPDAKPRGFELPIDGARRVTLEIDAGDDGDLGDSVRWVRPRMVK